MKCYCSKNLFMHYIINIRTSHDKILVSHKMYDFNFKEKTDFISWILRMCRSNTEGYWECVDLKWRWVDENDSYP